MKYTFKDMQRDFPSDDVCLHYIFTHKFGEQKQCYKVRGRKCYAHSMTGHQIHPLKGTIFEKSSTPLTTWFYAIYLFSASKNGVSAKELQRHLGVTYKTAWRIAKKIRELMDEGDLTLAGTVEVDETYIGGREAKMMGGKGKEAVIGMVERQGRVKATHVENRQTHIVLNQVKKNVAKGTRLMTDEFKVYKKTPLLGYQHASVKHGKKHYARKGDVHTNTIEGFWSQLKRSLDGTYHVVSPAYLQSYVDEFSFRYNRRTSALPMFFHLLNQVSGA
jgi:transposase